MTDSISSALLAATTKSVKVLQNIQTKQEAMIEAVNAIAKEQEVQGDTLKAIQTKPEPEILSDIKYIVTDLSKAFSTIDLDALEKAIKSHSRQVAEQSELSLISRIDSVKDDVMAHSDTNTRKTVEAVKTTDKSLSDKVENLSTTTGQAHDAEMAELEEIKHSGQIETLRKLITGLKAQRQNLDKLADYIEILADNVQKNRRDVSSSVLSLVDTVQDSNARTKSMDMRLSAITGEDTDDSEDLEQSLALLQGLSNRRKPVKSKSNTPVTNNTTLDALNEAMKALGEE